MAEEFTSLDKAIDATLDSVDPSTIVDDGVEDTLAPLARNAPKSWAKEMHDHWGKLDPAVQDYIDRRETEIGEGFKRYGADAEYAQRLRQAFSQFEPDMNVMRATPEQAVNYLFTTYRGLAHPDMNLRAQTFARLQKELGVDMAKVGGEPKWEDPALKELTGRIDSLTESITAERTQAQQSRYNQILGEIQAFSADAAHSHFEAVADLIVPLLSNPAISLDQAYEQACWAHPEVRLKVMAEAQAKATQDAKGKAIAAAKAKGTQIRGTESGGSPGETLGSLDDTLRATLNKIKGRAA